jgi:hypothetical protein
MSVTRITVRCELGGRASFVDGEPGTSQEAAESVQSPPTADEKSARSIEMVFYGTVEAVPWYEAVPNRPFRSPP